MFVRKRLGGVLLFKREREINDISLLHWEVWRESRKSWEKGKELS